MVIVQLEQKEKKTELTTLYKVIVEILADLVISLLIQPIQGSSMEKIAKICQWIQLHMMRNNRVHAICLLFINVRYVYLRDLFT